LAFCRVSSLRSHCLFAVPSIPDFKPDKIQNTLERLNSTAVVGRSR
jgi:hypothetical protein